MEYSKELQKRTEQIEQILLDYLPKEEGTQKLIVEAMNYSMLAGGKRIRPILMLETCRLFGGNVDSIKPFIMAIELIHTSSLVHDDLPAIDNDLLRRGRKTTHAVYGESMGILAGDGLINYAYEICADGLVKTNDVKNYSKAFQVFADKAGIYGMLGGQAVDVCMTKQTVNSEKLDFIYRLKTGALIESAMMVGAIMAGASIEQVHLIQKIALHVGIAFQIQDDILDVTSTDEVLGKPILSDERNHKTTYVSLNGLDQARMDVAQISKEALSDLKSLNLENEFLEQMLYNLIYREK